MSEARTNAAKKAWETRRKRKDEVSERQRRAAHKAWATRRAREAQKEPIETPAPMPMPSMDQAMIERLADAVVAKLRAEGLVVAAN